MPFTLVHPAAVLPVARSPLVPSALVIGAMAPDLPYFVSLQWIGGDYNLTLTHAWSSLLWLDPVIALLLLAVFQLILKRPLAALLPESAAARIVKLTEWPEKRRWWAAALLSVMIGAATHLAWDKLCDVFGAGWSMRLNLLSDLLGAVVLLALGRRWWRATGPRPIPPGRLLPFRERVAALLAIAAATLAGGVLGIVRKVPDVWVDVQLHDPHPLRSVTNYALREFAIDAVMALGAAVLLYAVAWHAARLRAPETARSR